MEKNIRYSHMSHWKGIPYKQIPNFRDFYYEDKTNIAYYQDWDMILKYHAGTGFEGLEVAPWDLMDILKLFKDLVEFKEFAAERGVEISGMFHGLGPAHEKKNHEALIAQAQAAVDKIVIMGGKHMNVCPGIDYAACGPISEEGFNNTIELLNEVGRYSEDHGVQLGIHNEFFCLMNYPQHRRMVEATDPRYVHYCIDTAQISLLGEDLCTFYDDYHDRISTFHLKDTADPKVADEVRYAPSNPEIQDDGHRWFWEPGLGVLDFEGLFKLLKKHHFTGWATVETDGTPDLLASMAYASYFYNHEMAKIYR